MNIPNFDIVFNFFGKFYIRKSNGKLFSQVAQKLRRFKVGTPNV